MKLKTLKLIEELLKDAEEQTKNALLYEIERLNKAERDVDEEGNPKDSYIVEDAKEWIKTHTEREEAIKEAIKDFENHDWM